MRIQKKLGALGVSLCILLNVGCYPFAFHGRQVVPDTHNYWYQPTGTIHVAPNQSERVLWHEWCHGWQGETLAQTDVGLVRWKQTPSGADFNGSLELAADVCAYYCMGVPLSADNSEYDYMTYVDPTWQTWAERWVDCPSD